MSNYKWTDEQPVNGYNYYRVKSTDMGGEIQYSKTTKVWMANNGNGIIVYPNPSANGIVHLQFNNQPAGKYQLHLVDNTGRIIQSSIILRNNQRSSTETIALRNNIVSGSYVLHIIRPDNTEMNVDIIYEP